MFFEPPPRAAARPPRSRTRRRSTAYMLDRRTQLLYDDHASLHQRRRACRGRRTAPRRSGASPTPRARPAAAPRHVAGSGRRSFTIGTAMVTSTPASPDGGEPTRPAPRYEALSTVAEQVAAIDTLIGLAKRSIRVFDIDLSGMGWNERRARRRLAAFLRALRAARGSRSSCTTRGWIERSCPRLTRSEVSRPRDHDTANRRGRASRDGSADDRRRRPLPASLQHRPAARGAGDRRPGGRRRRSSRASMRSGRPRSRDLPRRHWVFDVFGAPAHGAARRAIAFCRESARYSGAPMRRATSR